MVWRRPHAAPPAPPPGPRRRHALSARAACRRGAVADETSDVLVDRLADRSPPAHRCDEDDRGVSESVGQRVDHRGRCPSATTMIAAATAPSPRSVRDCGDPALTTSKPPRRRTSTTRRPARPGSGYDCDAGMAFWPRAAVRMDVPLPASPLTSKPLPRTRPARRDLTFWLSRGRVKILGRLVPAPSACRGLAEALAMLRDRRGPAPRNAEIERLIFSGQSSSKAGRTSFTHAPAERSGGSRRAGNPQNGEISRSR